MNRLWQKENLPEALTEPCLVVLSLGQLCVVLAALLDSELEFHGEPASSYPLMEIRAAIARVDVVMRAASGEAAA